MRISNPPPSTAYRSSVPATANYGLLSVGLGPWDGSTAGHFPGNVNGTGVAISLPGGFAGNAVMVATGGTTTFNCDSNGNVSLGFVSDLANTAPYIRPLGNAMTIYGRTADNLLLVVTPGVAGQTADLFRATTSTGGVLTSIRADGLTSATVGLGTKQKAGAPVDADWTTAPPDGTVVVDSTNSKWWVRVNGLWKGVAVA